MLQTSGTTAKMQPKKQKIRNMHTISARKNGKKQKMGEGGFVRMALCDMD